MRPNMNNKVNKKTPNFILFVPMCYFQSWKKRFIFKFVVFKAPPSSWTAKYMINKQHIFFLEFAVRIFLKTTTLLHSDCKGTQFHIVLCFCGATWLFICP